jgi:hypothetical protein
MKAICFHCHFVGVGVALARCPQCTYPLIQDMGGAALGSSELARLFNRPAARAKTPLPGVSPEPRQAQLLMEKRRARSAALAQARHVAEVQGGAATPKRRHVLTKVFASLFAASAVAAGVMALASVVL